MCIHIYVHINHAPTHMGASLALSPSPFPSCSLLLSRSLLSLSLSLSVGYLSLLRACARALSVPGQDIETPDVERMKHKSKLQRTLSVIKDGVDEVKQARLDPVPIVSICGSRPEPAPSTPRTICTCIYKQKLICTYVCLYIYIYSYTHTHTHPPHPEPYALSETQTQP